MLVQYSIDNCTDIAFLLTAKFALRQERVHLVQGEGYEGAVSSYNTRRIPWKSVKKSVYCEEPVPGFGKQECRREIQKLVVHLRATNFMFHSLPFLQAPVFENVLRFVVPQFRYGRVEGGRVTRNLLVLL